MNIFKLTLALLTVFLINLSAFANTCGNSNLEKDEECEISLNYFCADGRFCGCNCMCFNTCGNGFLGSGEECDDGNNLNGDGCTSECKVEHSYCNEKCLSFSKWNQSGHVINGKECPNNEYNIWQISDNLNCCCMKKDDLSQHCLNYEVGSITLNDLEKKANEVLDNCNLSKTEKGNPFKKENIKYELSTKDNNLHCGKADCSNKIISISLCNKKCSSNLCAEAIHEIEHIKRCNNSKNEIFTNIESCEYIAEEIVVQNESFKNCILEASPTCNCEHERIYIIKECNLYNKKVCKENLKEITDICRKYTLMHQEQH